MLDSAPAAASPSRRFFTAYTSPNGSFRTVKELAFKVAHASKFAPYGLVAFELSGQADGGSDGRARTPRSASARAGRWAATA